MILPSTTYSWEYEMPFGSKNISIEGKEIKQYIKAKLGDFHMP
jgi:hypothetical protein